MKIPIWHQWRTIRKNPVYLREKGEWGNPNSFYDNLSRFSPLVVLLGVVSGTCASIANPFLFSENDTLTGIYCLICFPLILLNIVTLYGAFMAPALTAPSISIEMEKGTWLLLRTTPMTTRTIIGAKLFGSLARLRIWPLLLLLSILQGFFVAASLPLLLVNDEPWILSIIIGASTALRPWLEIFSAATIGMFVSTWNSTPATAVAISYSIVIPMRLVNSTATWLFLTEVVIVRASPLISVVGPTLTYLVIFLGLWGGIMYRAKIIE